MPYSFGRMESHCFGCEGIFRGELAQQLAEQVFGELLQKDVTKPQLHYLLGQLRESQNRSAEALASFRKAVELDPDYVNAWKQVLEHTKTSAERVTATTNLMRLNPRKASFRQQGLAPRDVWELTVQHLKSLPPDPPVLLSLAASKKHREELRTHLKAAKLPPAAIEEWLNETVHYTDEPSTLGSMLAKEKSMSAACSLFGTYEELNPRE